MSDKTFHPPEWTMTPLELIVNSSGDLEHATDKESSHSYGPTYDKLFREIVGRKNLRILEIGIFSGGFIKVMHKLFPNAHIYGIDIDLKKYRLDKNPNIHLYEMDGTLEETADLLNETFDLIIDDGSHFMEHQKFSLDIFAPYLKKRGIYVIEDINPEYLPVLKYDLKTIGQKHNLEMEWLDLTHNKGRFDDILAIFRKRL